MEILVVFDAATLRVRRFVGPMPVPIAVHVGEGEGHYVCDTTKPKSPAEIQDEVIAHMRGAA